VKQIFIDRFVIPENAFKEFSERMNYNRSFIKNISGFIQDKVYKSIDEAGNIIIITMAEWKDEESLHAAKALVQEEYKKINFNPGEFTAKLNIKMERGIFNEISSY
jgi:heme-degrading monooxygenase HmoA